MILSIDIGGTFVKMGIVDANGIIHARHEAELCFDQYKTPILTTVINEAHFFLQNSGASISGIGVSATGQIDMNKGSVIGTTGKIPHYEGTDIREEMERAFGVPVFVMNDANAAILGEFYVGRAKGMQHVVMLTLGTGVGGGVIVDGRLLTGARGIAGELGRMSLYRENQSDAEGRCGYFEEYAATTALIRHAHRKTGFLLNGQEIFERIQTGDVTLKAILDQWIEDIATGIASLIHIFNPQIVLIGGGVSTQEELLIAPLRKRVLASVMPRFAENTQIERAILGNDAGIVGAAMLLQQRANELYRN